MLGWKAGDLYPGLAAIEYVGAGVEGVGMNRSYTAHAGENTQAAMPWNVHKVPVDEVYKIPDKVTLSDSLWG